MNFEQLYEKFVTDTNIGSGEVDNTEFAFWLNEAQLDLSWELGVSARHEYPDAETGQEYALPVGALRIIESSAPYEITAMGNITFAGSGSHSIVYRKMPTDFTGTDMAQVSGLHPALHQCLVLFANSRYWDKENEGDREESELATKWMSYYQLQKRQITNKLSATLSPIKVDRWQVI